MAIPMRKFLGFTPDQANILLGQKGFKPNSREAAEYLAGMYDKAQNLINQRAYQYGGQVGGFDDASRKLFDAAVRRTSSTDPKSPEVQRYLDNVIETRGKPTMVFPGTADPLQGYQEGGTVGGGDTVTYDSYGMPMVSTGAKFPLDKEKTGVGNIGIPENFPTEPPLDPRKDPPDPRDRLVTQPVEPDLTPEELAEMRKRFEDAINQEQPTPPTAPEQAKLDLDNAQANLSTQQTTLSNLQQELANLGTAKENDEKRIELVKKIEDQQTAITQAEAALSSASAAFSVVATPTAAEAVGATYSTPKEVMTEQDVDLLTDTQDPKQFIDETKGQVGDRTDVTATTGVADTADAPVQDTTSKATATDVTDDIRNEELKAATGKVSPDAEAKAQVLEDKELAINDVEAATDTDNVQVESPAKRKLEHGETFSGVANAEVAKEFLEGVEAATGAPSSAATVQGQLTGLMEQFEGDVPPPWAAGAMRQATAVMAQRGLAASSMAGQAIVQAAMESAIPIAMQDAKTVAQFEAQNLSNRQERQMLAAQQRAQFLGMEFDQEFQARVANAATISDIANRNFSAEVQISLENARLAQTTDLTVLGNKQALVMAKAAALQEMDMANLNNRQQAEIRNADAFLQMDMANLSNEQQAAMFTNQSIVQGLFTDAANENAMAQFNATSENQANQFFAKLETQVNEFNAAQTNAMTQFNAGEENALTKFQENLNNQRDMFNAQNQLVIAQANAQWRQQLATINNAAQNEANRQDALQANNLTQKSLDEIWQRERDLMAYAFTSAENAENRRVTLMQSELDAEATSDSAFSSALGVFAGAVVNGIFGMYKT